MNTNETNRAFEAASIVRRMTENNCHTEARYSAAKFFATLDPAFEAFKAFFKRVCAEHNRIGYLPEELAWERMAATNEMRRVAFARFPEQAKIVFAAL